MQISKSWAVAPHTETFCLGLDVGQQNDYSALAAVSQLATPGLFDATRQAYLPVWELQVRWLERWPLGTPFATVVRRAVAVRNALVIPGERSLGKAPVYPPIVLDSTGVGLPLVEMFRTHHQVTPVAVVITGGDTVNATPGGFRVPKKDLIGALSVEFELQRVKIVSGLDLADDLLGELKNFRMETNAATGRTRYNALEGHHDDLLIAVALAVWRLHWHRTQVVRQIKLRGV
jgi:hypothetical protein